MQLNAVRS